MPPYAEHFSHVVSLERVRDPRHLGDPGIPPSGYEPDEKDQRSGCGDGPFQGRSRHRFRHRDPSERGRKQACPRQMEPASLSHSCVWRFSERKVSEQLAARRADTVGLGLGWGWLERRSEAGLDRGERKEEICALNTCRTWVPHMRKRGSRPRAFSTRLISRRGLKRGRMTFPTRPTRTPLVRTNGRHHVQYTVKCT